MNAQHPPAGGTRNQSLSNRGRRLVIRSVAGLGAAGLLAGAAVAGSAAASAASTSARGPAGGTVSAVHHRLGVAAELARVRRCFIVADVLRKSGHPRLARATFLHCEAMLLRDFRGLHGQITYKTKTGSATVAFERGKITSINGTTVTVTAADSTAINWAIVSGTKVAKNAHWVSLKRLATGEHVFVIGPVVGGVDDARLVMIGG